MSDYNYSTGWKEFGGNGCTKKNGRKGFSLSCRNQLVLIRKSLLVSLYGCVELIFSTLR